MAKLGHEWDWSEAFKPKRVVAQKLLTIRAPDDWDEDQINQALFQLENYFMSILKVRQGLLTHLDIEFEPVDSSQTRRRRRL